MKQGFVEKFKREQAASAGIQDRYGRAITAGCEIDIGAARGTGNVFVQTITPSMDPRHPAGMVRITAVTQYAFLLPAGQPIPEFLRVRTPEELVAAGVLQERPDLTEAGEGQVAIPEEEAPTAADGADTPDTPGPRLIHALD